MTDELEVISPKEVTVKFNGEEIKVSPIRMGKLQAFTAAVKPIAFELMGALEGSADWLSIVERHADKLIDAVHIATGVPRETLNDCDPAEFIQLATAVIQVNTDFFVHRLLPTVRVAVERLTKTVKAGQQSFKG